MNTPLTAPPSLSGINHITLTVADLARSTSFYVDVLSLQLRAQWRRGAYLSGAGIWLCLQHDPAKQAARDGGHIAFGVGTEEFAVWREHLARHRVRYWKQNTSEGDSLYFVDPDGHRLEVHCGDLNSRLQACRQQPYEDMQWFD